MSQMSELTARTCKFPQLIVTMEKPHHIVATETGFDDLLGHKTDHLRFQTMDALTGPLTDRRLMEMLVESTFTNNCFKHQLMIYGRSRMPIPMLLHFAQFQCPENTEHPHLCLITFELSHAILLKDAVTGHRCAQAVVATERPHRVHFMSEAFRTIFGFSPAQMLGKSIALVHGPDTDAFRWRALLHNAINGQANSGILILRTAAGDQVPTLLCCTPVVEKLNGRITYILLQLQHLTTDPTEIERFCSPDICVCAQVSVSGSEVPSLEAMTSVVDAECIDPSVQPRAG